MTTTMRPATDVQDHRMWELSSRAAVTAADVDPAAGLSTGEAAARPARWGPPAPPPARPHGAAVRFLLQFHSPLIYVLLVSALAAALIGERVDAAVIVTVLVVNALVGFVQESRAGGALAALAAMTETTSTVVRDGARLPVPSPAVVPGDLVVLEPGDKVPADLRLVEAHELRADESALTGESAPAAKATDALPAGTGLAGRRNLAFSSTLVTAGSGIGVVAAASARAVGAIPEGLPAMVTIALAFGVARMVRRKVVIRRLPVGETLGSTTVICTDKTGTLTENKMTVIAVVAGGETYDLPGPEGDAAVRECLLAGLV